MEFPPEHGFLELKVQIVSYVQGHLQGSLEGNILRGKMYPDHLGIA